jgi:hypothetical protein
VDTTEEDQTAIARKRDALALAQLILDIYSRKKREGALLATEEAEL